MQYDKILVSQTSTGTEYDECW